MHIRLFCLAALITIIYICIGGTPAGGPPDIKPSEVSEITVIRLGDNGSPADVLTFHSDGSATYEGQHDVERVGMFKGTMPEGFGGQVFPQLAAPFAELASHGFSFGKPTHGLTPVTIRVKWTGGVKEYTDWTHSDERAWACEMIARGVASDIAWKK